MKNMENDQIYLDSMKLNFCSVYAASHMLKIFFVGVGPL